MVKHVEVEALWAHSVYRSGKAQLRNVAGADTTADLQIKTVN